MRIRLSPETQILADCVAYHYCSVRTLLNILQQESLSFRLSNLFFMNDLMEVNGFFSWLKKTTGARRRGVRRDPSDVAPSGEFGEAEIFDADIWDELHELLALQRPFDHIYAACFSKNSDDLTQWRGYADDAKGVTLALDLQLIAHHCFERDWYALDLVEVEYYDEEDEPVIPWLILSNECRGSRSGLDLTYSLARRVYWRLAGVSPRYKHKAFQSENEVRLVVQKMSPLDGDFPDPSTWNSDLFSGFPSLPEFCERNGSLVPFVKVDIPPVAVKKIGFGPCFGGDAQKAALQLFVRKQLPDVEVEFYSSRAPYR